MDPIDNDRFVPTCKRINDDLTANEAGLALISFCKSHNYIICNGRSSINSSALTFIDHQGTSVIDYCIASSNIFHTVADVNIGDMLDLLHLPLIVIWHCKSTSLTLPVSSVI